MGHFESSGKYSLFAKRLFEITRHKGNDFFERIKELNKILICQSTVENYIAADFFIKDQNSNKYLLYKYLMESFLLIKYSPIQIIREMTMANIRLALLTE